MSFFGVTVEKIKEVLSIEGADRIEIARLDGMDYQFVIGKGQFKSGESVLYIPVDSVVPDDVLAKLGLEGKLAGSKRNRVKTIKLRGQISQGIVADSMLVPPETREAGTEAITKCLGVEKYIPPEVPCHNAILRGLPDAVPVYDIESADRNLDVVKKLMNQKVMITEKVEGTNFSLLHAADGEIMVNQHHKTIIPKEGVEHTFWKVAHDQDILGFAKALSLDYPKQDVLIYGEMLGPGIQKNIYKLSSYEVLFFDIMVNREWMDSQRFMDAVTGFYGDAKKAVPVLCIGVELSAWLGGRTIKEASNGVSSLRDGLREGVVIKPMQEQRDSTLGRLFLKQRSPEYLAKEK